MFSLILIYLILQIIYFYNKQKKRSLFFYSWFQFYYSFFVLIFFTIFFVFFLRILSFFREYKILDLKLLIQKYDIKLIILFIVFLFFFRKLIIFLAKINFFKLHYYYLAPHNNKYYLTYYKIYIKGIHVFCRKVYPFMYYFDKMMLCFLIITIGRDLVLFDFVLDYSLYFMKYYSLFKLIFIIINFVATKQDLLMDYYLFNTYYLCSPLDEGFYAETIGMNSYAMDKYEENIIKN